MEIIGISLDAIQSFLAYLVTATALTLIYIFVYIWVTPHPEIAFAGSLVGFSLPLASVIAHSVALTDCVIWGLIAILVQVFIFFLVRLPIRGISERIEKGETSSGLWLGAASLAGGLLNAACMSP